MRAGSIAGHGFLCRDQLFSQVSQSWYHVTVETYVDYFFVAVSSVDCYLLAALLVFVVGFVSYFAGRVVDWGSVGGYIYRTTCPDLLVDIVNLYHNHGTGCDLGSGSNDKFFRPN